MITVIKSGGSLSMNGHAGYAPAGRDIVCAAATMLAYTLAIYAEKHGGRAEMAEGAAVIEAESGEVADAVWEGFRMLARKYPNNVTCVED